MESTSGRYIELFALSLRIFQGTVLESYSDFMHQNCLLVCAALQHTKVNSFHTRSRFTFRERCLGKCEVIEQIIKYVGHLWTPSHFTLRKMSNETYWSSSSFSGKLIL